MPIISHLLHLPSHHNNILLTIPEIIGTSLLCKWQPPRVDTSNDRPDLVGDGGDAVSSYLVEWSRISFDSYTPTVFEINLETASGSGGSDALGLLSGSFQVQFDTSASGEAVVSGSYASASIPVGASIDLLKTILENIPNVGEVEVYSPEPLTWRITFLTELGDIDMTLANNRVYDDGMVAGTVDISKISTGTIPQAAAYGFEIINDISSLTTTDDGSINYIIEHLVPGMKVFVRVSAGNQVGFGPRRTTAPEFAAPALQRPDVPASLYTEDMPPYLSVHSPTALKVHIGPPFYDGGSPLTSFLIEWDTSPTFDSSLTGDGSPLGYTQANAASQVCNSCVGDFDVVTNTFIYSGNEDTAKLLIPQRKIMVHFHDDNESYIFSVLSASSSMINVSSKHLRVTSLSSMKDKDGGVGSNLDLLGTTHIIAGLDTGHAYYVRVSSENGEMGTGRSIGTMPLSATPRGFPLPPSVASASVVDKNTLNVSWSSDAFHNDPTIQAFKVERFWKSGAASSSSFSFFGEQEVVQLSTSGLGLSGGTFHLYFGELADASTNVLLGTAKATTGLDYVETHGDLSPHLHRGESILIGDEEYFVHDTDLFTSTRLPLSTPYTGSDTESIFIHARSKSMPIAYDATVEEVRNALEQMPHVNHVNVRREIDDAFDDGYEWFVTFTSNVGPQPDLSVDTSNLIGTNPLGFTISSVVPGVLPDDYDVTLVQDPTVTSYEMEGLLTGKPYYIRVSSIADQGESLPMDSSPIFIAPGGVPGDIPPPSIKPLNENTLLVSFEAAAQANGASVDEYIVESSSSDPSFTQASVITVHPNHKVQRVTTRAHTLPWDDSSSFTLSLGDYHGDFTVPVGQGETTVKVQNGDNVLERSTGGTSLSSVVVRGDYVSVGGVEFRVCLLDSQPHDDSHLSLCSKENALEEAYFYADSQIDMIDELPIFILDTSLGAAKSPAIGDIFLSTVDASGSSKDTRGRLRRGDLIRVGHPETGESFRVSTDIGRAFTDQVVPLSSVDDANMPASLSSKSLQHATYEIQSFYIRSSVDTVTLTPSNVLSSGFRIRFKSETTQSTTAGGANGCLAWDGDANDVKVELELLSGIDMVEVSREDLPSIDGGVGAGVMYHVTFTGLNVRGNIPPLQIVDVGSNGCLDSHLLGGNFGQDIAPIVVEQVVTPYVPFYEIQTTTDIPYDASSADMKAALEALSQVCTVDVSRMINRHGYSWDITFVEIEGSSYSPLLALSANAANLLADIDPGVEIIPIQHVEVPTLTGGTPYFVRVAAVNSFGMGPYTLSNPRATEVSLQPPSEPVDVFAEAISDTEILVQWNPPLENGGRPITHYKVEYDELPSFTSGQHSGPLGSVLLSSSAIGTVSDVQLITVKIDNEGLLTKEAYLSGTFSLEFDGQKTGQLPYNASPEEMKTSLEDLCNVHEVSVTRSIHCSPDPLIGCMTPEGYSWLVTFVSLNTLGDQHYRHTSKLSSRTSHKLSVDGSFLFQCSDVARTTCSIGGNAVANVGTVQEVQQISIALSPFSVTIGGETSEVINLGDSLSQVEAKLNSYSKNGVGRVSVTCAGCIDNVISAGDSMLLYFSSYQGDLPPVVVSDPAVVVSEVTKGRSQFVVGRASYSTVLSGLTSVHDWHVRVFAYNGIGEGPPQFVWPSPLRLTAVAPQVPENIAVTVESATSLQVGWDRPISIGGAQLSSFVIEYDTSPSFTTQNGMPLGHLAVVEADADVSIAFVTQSYPDSSDSILRRRIVIDNVDVISQGLIGPGSMLVIGGQQLMVVSINDESCGVTCLTMDTDAASNVVSGVKVYDGLDPRHYKYPITGLTPGTSYYIRVAAVNEKSVGPFAFVGYPLFPITSTPVDVPTALSWASLTSISHNELRIDFGTPSSSDNPYGVNGLPLSQYHIEVASAELYRPEIISITTKADSASVSGFIELSVGYQGEYNMVVSVGNQPAQFMVENGSRFVNTMGDDLTSVLHPGEKIVIEDELVEVLVVSADKIELREYHVQGTDGLAVAGYRMNNYIGSTTIAPGDNSFTEDSGQNMESIIRSGEVIEVTNGGGDKQYLTVSSITGSSVSFSPSFVGSTITKTPIYTRKKVIVPANSSSAAMQASIESLEDVGSVEVSRDGPNSFDGYTWYITFSSNSGMPSCSHPSWCLASSTESVNYVTVMGSGLATDGNYIQTSFYNGRSQYNLLGTSSHVLYDVDSSEWRLYSDNDSVASFVASSLDASVPLSGWSNGLSVAFSSNPTELLKGVNAAAEVTTLQTGVPPLFEDVVFSEDVPAGQHEVQEVVVLSDEDDLGGSYQLSLGDMSQKVTIYSNESTGDFTTKLEALAGIGRVRIDLNESSDGRYGRMYLITFISSSSDVPLLKHHGTINLEGTNVSLEISERVKGTAGQGHIVVGGLDEGGVYASRIHVENEAGAGPSTFTSQAFGGGVHPLARSVSSPPGPPSLELGTVTKSQAIVKITEPSSNGSDISSYKIEWTSSSNFGLLAEASAQVSCSDGSEVLGSVQFIYEDSNIHSLSEVSVPIDIRSSAGEISQILNAFELTNEIEVTTITDEAFEIEWTVSFLYDVGPVGSLSLDTARIRCQSEQPVVDSSTTMSTVGSMPADYDSMEIFTDQTLCGSLHLGEFSSLSSIRDESNCINGADNTVAIVAKSLTTVGGTFDIHFGRQSAVGVTMDTSELEMQDILASLIDPTVQVTKHTHDDGIAWALTYPGSLQDDVLRVDDTMATGRNAAVNVLPILLIKTYSPDNDSSGQFRVLLDGESTGPLPVSDGHATVLQEMHRLNGIGKVSFLHEEIGGDYSMIIESYTSDLSSLQVLPESDWRGTSPRIFFKSPFGSPSHTFVLPDLDKDNSYIVRAMAKNDNGYGPPSNVLTITPKSSVPSYPTGVALSW